jgi:hypothetical protein
MNFIAEEFSCGRRIVGLMITGEVVISAASCAESYGRGFVLRAINHVAINSCMLRYAISC